jgi:hypothetical protein
MVSYWDFEETTGLVAYDTVSDYHGDHIKTPTLGETGVIGNCYSYAAVDTEYIDVGSFWELANGDMTAAGWFKLSSINRWHGIIGNAGGESGEWHVVVEDNNRLYGNVIFGVDTSLIVKTVSNSTLLVDTWYHFAFIIDRDGETTLYLDGVAQTDHDDISSFSSYYLGGLENFAIGSHGKGYGGYTLNGFVDELGVWDRVLAASEVADLEAIFGYSFLFGCTDSLRMQMANVDATADSFRVNFKYGSYPTSRTDGTLLFAFGDQDTTSYKDTTFEWLGAVDAQVNLSLWSGSSDDWTVDANQDTAYKCTKAIAPPDTTLTFSADEHDLGTAIITAINFDETVDSIRLNYVENAIPPVSREAGTLVLASSDTSDYNNLQVIVPVPKDSSIYTFAMWLKYGDFWTGPGVSNYDSVLLHTVDTADNYTISRIFGGSSHELDDSLFAYYNFEEISGSALDQVGSNNLPLVGSVTQDTTGIIDSSYFFGDNFEYLAEIDTEFEFDGSFSLSCWIKSEDTDPTSYIISNFGPAQYGYTLFIGDGAPPGGGKATANFRDGVGSTQLNGTTTINDGAWHHLVTSYSAVDDSLKLWVDGVLEDVDEIPLGIVYNASCRFTIGRRDGTGVSQFFLDSTFVDEIGIWRGVELTAENVDSLWSAGSAKSFPYNYVDSLQFQITNFDPELDSIRINFRYDSIPTSRTDGTLWGAFDESDTTNLNDTTFLWTGLNDTTVYWGVWHGKNNSWTVAPNGDSIGLFLPDTANSLDASHSYSYASGSLADSLFAYYDLEEAAGDALDQIGSNDLSVNGTVTRQQTGIINDCYTFATNGFLGEIDTEFEFDGSFSLSCWAKTSATGIYYMIANFGAAQQGYELLLNSNKAQFTIRYSSDRTDLLGTTTINDDLWHHIVATYNAVDDTAKLWVDGNLEIKKLSPAPVYNTSCRFTLGRRDGTGVSQYFWDGELDEIAIYDGLELSENKVDSLYNLGASREYPTDFGGSSEADSVTIQISGMDVRADSFQVRYSYVSYPTLVTEGLLQFAFGIADTTDYNDTTFGWTGYNDTIVYYTLFSRAGGAWTFPPNRDTVLVGIEGGDPDPPPDPPTDPTGHDVIWSLDFDHHASAAPFSYTEAAGQQADFPNTTYFNSEPENRYPGTYPNGWQYHPGIEDSIIIDDLSGSAVLKESFQNDYLAGYDGQSPARGGDGHLILEGFRNPTRTYTELYVSVNVRLRNGWRANRSGKLAFQIAGGSDVDHGQGSTEGFTCSTVFHVPESQGGHFDDPAGIYPPILEFYLYWQDQPYQPSGVGAIFPWDEYNPVGQNLEYRNVTFTGQDGVYLNHGKNRWYNITIRLVVNTFTGSTQDQNGLIEGFVNGYLVGQQTGLNLLGYDDINDPINHVRIRCFYGGGSSPPIHDDEWIYLDDWVFWQYDNEADVPRGNTPSPEGRILSLPPEADIDKIQLGN